MDQTLFGIVAGVIAAVIALLRVTGRIGTTNADLRRVERKVDSIMKQLGMDAEQAGSAPPSDRVTTYLSAGKSIEAIRTYREENPGVGLADAKAVVDDYKRRTGMN